MVTEDNVKKIIAILSCIIILGLSAWFIVSPKQGFSENENRYLAKTPVFSLESVISGKYMESVSEWLSDHFPARDFFMGLKSAAETGTGRRMINGIYIADDDYLIESYTPPVNTKRISDTLHRFYEKASTSQADIRLMLVPTAVTILQDKLPAYAPAGGQTATIREICEKSAVPAIDCTAQLYSGASGGQLYYRTDHHWTTYGAYQGYLAYCKAKGLVPVPLESFEAQKVTEEFAGTLYSKVNDYTHKKDTITVYTNPEDKLTVNYTDTGEVTDSLYNMSYLDEKDKYSLFLNNIHTLVEIENENAPSDAALMLIKDSYANSMVPFLAHHYRKIYVFDTRYYKDGPSGFLSAHSEITDVLLLYNMNTIDTDTGIRGIY